MVVMLKPTAEQIERMAEEYPVIPVCRELYADVVTPIALLRRLAAVSSRYYLLESVEGGERWGRYSFLGYDPIKRVTCKNGTVTVEEEGDVRRVETRHPLEVLRELLREYRSPRLPEMPPFTGGLVGSFSYEMIGYAEPVLKLPENEGNDFDLMLFDKVIAYYHLRQKIAIVVNMKTDRVLENYGRAVEEIDRIARLIAGPVSLPPLSGEHAASPAFVSEMDEQRYGALVERAKEYIRAGDIFQVVLSRRFDTLYKDSLLNAYRVLRTTNPSPYMVFLQADDTQLMVSSPETLVKLQDGVLSSYPLAGSRPRGGDEAADRALEEELLQDEKELSEHNMLVDLARNDVGRVAEFGSVTVPEYLRVHRYSKIMHLASVVEGRLRGGLDACDALQAILPAGTLSGAPKIRACQIIAELEGRPRGVYGGAVGYLDFSGNMDVCIAIRMAVKQGDKVTVQAGAGIVADSVPEREYAESGNKARAVMEAMALASEVND